MINNGGEQRNLLALFIIYSMLFRNSQTARSLNFRSILSLCSFFLARVNEGEKSDMREKGRERERERTPVHFSLLHSSFSFRLINRLIKSDELRFKLRASRFSSEPLISRSSVRQLSSGVAFAFIYNSSQFLSSAAV